MKLIVGLGNPEEKYARTYHNIGFVAVEDVAIEFDAQFNKTKCRALIAETFYNGEKIIIAKPQTYMNLSGESVKELIDYYKIDISDVVVIYDDFDLKKGALRLRENGSAGTHNGMRNIIDCLGTEDFKRIRVGFHEDLGEMPLVNYVLAKIPDNECEGFAKIIHKAALAAVDFAKGEAFSKIMLKYNINVK